MRLTIWHQLFFEFWLVNTWFYVHPRDQRVVTRLENIRQLNIRRGKNLDFQLSHRQILIRSSKEKSVFGIYIWQSPKYVGNKAKGRISKRASQESKARQILRKANISYPLIRTHCNTRFVIRPFTLLPTIKFILSLTSK